MPSSISASSCARGAAAIFFRSACIFRFRSRLATVGADHALRSVESLALDGYSEEALAREFWARAERFAGVPGHVQRAALRFSGARTRRAPLRNRRARALRRRYRVGARALLHRTPSRSLRLPDQLRRRRRPARRDGPAAQDDRPAGQDGSRRLPRSRNCTSRAGWRRSIVTAATTSCRPIFCFCAWS